MAQGLKSFYEHLIEWDDVSVYVLICLFAMLTFLIFFAIGALGTLAERKVSADLQKRLGPNRIGPFGLFQFVADALKMITKQHLMPKGANSFLYLLAPYLAFLSLGLSVLVLPLSESIFIWDFSVSSFYLVAVSSLMGIAIFLGGYASLSTWSLLGGLRGASQMISYEVPLVISLFNIVLLSGEASLQGIVQAQGGLPIDWFIFHNPFSFMSFFIFFICMLAETNRAPFDLPESESELVSGFHTEYSGMKYAFFAISEFAQVFVVSIVCSSLFLGGYQMPLDIFDEPILRNLAQLGTLFIKASFLYFMILVIRWSLPRLKASQLMSLSWKYLTPLSIFLLLGSACWMIIFGGKSFIRLWFS